MALELRLVEFRDDAGAEASVATAVSTAHKVIEYVPAAAPRDTVRTAGRREGSQPVDTTVGNVTETIRLAVPSDAPGMLETIKATCEKARRWAEGFRRDMRMTVQLRDLNQSDDWYEAKLLDGDPVLDNGRGRVINFQIERAPYWRETADRLMTLGNTGGMGTTVTIYNHEDDQPGYDNWVLVEPPPGNVPAETRIRLRNSYNDAARVAEVWVGWYDRPNLLTLQGEESELPVSIVNDGAFSNMAYGVADRFQWTLPQSTARDYVGLFRVFAAGSVSGKGQIQAGYEISPYQRGKWVNGAMGVHELVDLGVMALPPGGYVRPTRYPVRVWLECENESNVDFVQFIPLEQFRRWRFRGYDMQYSTCIVDDGIRDEMVYDWGGQSLPILDGYGERIALWPEGLLTPTFVSNDFVPGWTETHNQMLVFLQRTSTGEATPLRTAQVQVTCRGRWDVLPNS